MVGLVIVAHSACLAQGVKELADQMVQGKVPIATAGGIDDPNNPFGTDAMKVLQAIRDVYSEDGVVVLMDLGSALLSAEMALEFLPEEERRHVYLSDAPLVEGAIAAAVQASTGADVSLVLAEARNALQAKQSQLHLGTEAPETTEARAPIHGREIRLVVRNRLGLHARPAAQFVSTAARFQSTVLVRNVTTGSDWVNAKSINQVATLGVRQGHEIAVVADGPDADDALAALRDLVEQNFGEEEMVVSEPALTPRPSPTPVEGAWTGIPASPGIAIGPAHLFLPGAMEVPSHPAQNPDEEWRRLQAAIQTALTEIQDLSRGRASCRRVRSVHLRRTCAFPPGSGFAGEGS